MEKRKNAEDAPGVQASMLPVLKFPDKRNAIT